MSSILTNNGAMVALQTLKSINTNLAKTQSEISTGKTVASAKDNSAVWAISKVMEADVKGFKGISDSLNLGSSTVAVARQAAETVTDLLTDIKGKIVAAQEENVDRAKIQTDIDALRDQINAVVGAAQFNGLNLLKNSDTTAGSGTVNILSSLDRSGTGVAASDITVRKQDLGTQQESIDTSGGATFTATAATALTINNANGSDAFDLSSLTITAGTAYALNWVGTDADSNSFTPATYTNATAGGTLIAEAAASVTYVARDGDTAADIAKGLAAAYADFAADNSLDTDVLNITATNGALTASKSNTYTDAADQIVVRFSSIASTANVIGGGLAELANIDVTTQSSVDQALTNIEGLIQTAIDSAAAFGSAQGRIDTQSKFVSGLTDALKSGIGTLVDADMEEASARLQALQVQQQLGVQALSIANQAPQSLLSLFQ
ncbi:MAG: flagellin [Pelagimonas sp.]|jgi:flagellin|nr:flagellin [Pelagimonas sp.]